MSTKKVVWNEKISATEFNTIYPRTVADQVVLNNTINNNLGIDVDSHLDTALEHISDTDKRIRAQGTSTGTSGALELSVPVFTLIDGIMARVKIHTDTAEGATLNVNATGAKPIIRIDGEPIDLVLKQGTWCIFIYSSTLDSWIFDGWSTKTVVKSAIFTESGSWTVPANVTSVNVFLFGGGGGAGYTSYTVDGDNSGTGYGGGGGSGHMAKSTLAVTPGQSIAITIGAGGARGSSGGTGGTGGTTSFGTLLSAQGGSGGGSGTSTSSSAKGGDGGNGGAGGGGGSAKYRAPNPSYPPGPSHYAYVQPYGKGGNGAQFGGGAGGYGSTSGGGNGGQYGGGGGTYGGTAGTGGQYGGKGGTKGAKGVNGTDTTSIVGLEFTGRGLAGNVETSDKYPGGSGGGGYGGNGGNSGYYSGGGGGGYGADAGIGTGGGGYGGVPTGTGGGGYGADNYGRGGNSNDNNTTDVAGKSGICIITWTAQEA